MDEREWMKMFGLRIRSRMEELEITQAELVRLSGIPQSSLSVYLRGMTEPRITAITKLAKALGVAPSYLVDFEVKK